MKIRNLTLPFLALAVAVMATPFTANLANADVIGELGVLDSSTGLVEGDQYRLVFLTLGTTNALSADITTYNEFVQAEAAASTVFGLLGNGTWNIVGSTTSDNAMDNTGTNDTTDPIGVPIYLLDGTTLFVGNNTDLWDGNLSTNVSLDQNGDALSDNRTWTGSDGDGTDSGGAGNNLALGEGATGGGFNVRTGNSAQSTGGWMIDFNSDPANENSVYAMSEVLTVAAIPEPGSLAVLGLGSVMMLVRRRRG